MATKIKLDKWYWHEALDRANSVTEIIQHMLLDHPVIKQNKELKLKAEKAQELIGELYQEIGAKQ